jgi:tRNA dimethylallyltransferase
MQRAVSEGLEPAAVLIAGPTASGKSAFALALAKATGGVVINTDSMQVYRDLRVLTARPSDEEVAQAPHALYGVIDGAENFSAARYQALAAAAIREAQTHGRLPILTGGTGLYFKALEEGLSDIPPVPDAVREAVRATCEGVPTAALHARLAAHLPDEAARLRASDRLRVMRALEVLAATGKGVSQFHGARAPGPLAGAPLARLFLAPERAALHAAIDRRFVGMIAAGALDEVRALAARGLSPLLPIMRAHGAPALMAHLKGEMTLEAAILRGQADTRSYVKRQFTWFRHQMPGWRWLEDEAARTAALAQLAAGRVRPGA